MIGTPPGPGSRVAALDLPAVDRIGPIEHRPPTAPLRGLLHHVAHRELVGVETNPDVLQIDDQRVDAVENRFTSAGACRPCKREWIARPVGASLLGRHIRIEHATNAVLRAEERHECHARRRVRTGSIALAVARSAGVIGSIKPTRLPRSCLNPSRARTSIPARTGPQASPRKGMPPQARLSAAARTHGSWRHPHWAVPDVSAAAATVAILLRRIPTSPVPSGCSRLDRKITYEIRRGIDPQAGTGESGVSIRGACRKQIAAVARIRRVDIPAKTTNARHARGRLRRRHGCHRRRRQHARSPEPAFPQQHSSESLEIASGAEETRVAGDAAHSPRGGIVNDAQQRHGIGALTGPRVLLRASLGRRDPRQQRLRRQEPCFRHTERLEHSRLQIRIERLAGDALDDVTDQEEVDVAVDECLAGDGCRHFILREFDRRVVTGPWMQVDIGSKARDMRHQLSNGDGTFSVSFEPRDV